MPNATEDTRKLLGLDIPKGASALNLGVQAPVAPTQRPVDVQNAPQSPQEELMALIGDDLREMGAGNSKIQAGQKMSESSNALVAGRGTFLVEKGLQEEDAQTRVSGKIAAFKQRLAAEKADLEKVAAKQKAIKEDFGIRAQEIGATAATAVSLVRGGRPEEGLKALADQANASTMKQGIKVVYTGLDPNSKKLNGFTIAVDAEGNQVGEPMELKDATLMTEFPTVDFTTVFTEEEQLRMTAVAQAQADRAAAPIQAQGELDALSVSLGRAPTEGERQANAGVVQRQETGGAGAFSGSKQAVTSAESAQKAKANIDSAIAELSSAIDTGVGSGAAASSLVKGISNALTGVIDLVDPEGSTGISAMVKGSIPESVADGAEARKQIAQIGAALPFIVGQAFDQKGMALSNADRKFMNTIAGELQDITTTPEQAKKSLKRLQSFMSRLSQNALTVATQGATQGEVQSAPVSSGVRVWDPQTKGFK